MKDRVLAIVHQIARLLLESEDALPDEREIVESLRQAGFAAEEIDAAFGWMETARCAEPAGIEPAAGLRAFTRAEQAAATPEGLGFLLRLQQLGILDTTGFEEALEQLVLTQDTPAELQEVKVVAALTLLQRSPDNWHREIACFLENDLRHLLH